MANAVKKNNHSLFIVAAVVCLLAVLLGAFGSHILKAALNKTGKSELYNLANQYHFFHGLALFIAAFFSQKTDGDTVETSHNPIKSFKIAFVLLLVGIVFFSGTLYIYSATLVRTLAMLTPIGGLLLSAGWIYLIIAFVKKGRSS